MSVTSSKASPLKYCPNAYDLVNTSDLKGVLVIACYWRYFVLFFFGVCAFIIISFGFFTKKFPTPQIRYNNG